MKADSRDKRLLAWLVAATLNPDGRSLCEAGALVGSDYARLVRTFRHGKTALNVFESLTNAGWRMDVLALSPDGRMLVTASHDNTARMWSTETGEPVGVPLRHQAMVRAVAISSDGRRVVTGSSDGTARVWDATTGVALSPPLVHHDAVRTVAISPDSKTVATGSEDKTVLIWDAETGAPVGAPFRHADEIDSVRFSPDGKMIVTASSDATAWILSASSGRPLRGPMRHEARIVSAVFSPNGKLVATASIDNSARLWDTATLRPATPTLQHRSWVEVVAFSPDNNLLVTGSDDGTARLWNTQSGKPVGNPMVHQAGISSVTFSSDGKYVLTGSKDGAARLWSAANGEPITGVLRHDSEIFEVALSPDARYAFTTDSEYITRQWDLSLQRVRRGVAAHSSTITSLTFSRDGHLLVSAGEDGKARVWQVTPTLLPLCGFQHASRVNGTSFSPQEERLITASEDKTIRIWDVASCRSIGVLRHQGRVYSAAFSADGNYVVSGSGNAGDWPSAADETRNKISVWKASTGGSVGFNPRQTEVVYLVTTLQTGDGRGFNVLAADSRHVRLYTWNGREVTALGESEIDGVPEVLAIRPDGQTAVIGTSTGLVNVFSLKSPLKRTFPNLVHRGSVTAIAFSPDGRRIITATGWWLYFWDFATAERKLLGMRLLDGWAVGSAPMYFLNDRGDRVRVASADAGNLFIDDVPAVLDCGTTLKGDANQLLDAWQKKLGLGADKQYPGLFHALWP